MPCAYHYVVVLTPSAFHLTLRVSATSLARSAWYCVPALRAYHVVVVLTPSACALGLRPSSASLPLRGSAAAQVLCTSALP
jgi:hypothetical protein